MIVAFFGRHSVCIGIVGPFVGKNDGLDDRAALRGAGASK